jgi:hypothetical protein
LNDGQVSWRLIRPAEHRVMPWKNGLGTTAEIAVEPPGADIAGGRFLWRLSIAQVDRSCAFSAFPGYERTIMVISGNGMELAVGGRAAARLDRPYQPLVFSGDDAADCRLIDGSIRDFNLMVDRVRLTARLAVVRPGPSPERHGFAGATGLIHCLSGTVAVGGVSDCPPLAEGDTLRLADGSGKAFGLTLSGGNNAVAALIELRDH